MKRFGSIGRMQADRYRNPLARISISLTSWSLSHNECHGGFLPVLHPRMICRFCAGRRQWPQTGVSQMPIRNPCTCYMGTVFISSSIFTHFVFYCDTREDIHGKKEKAGSQISRLLKLKKRFYCLTSINDLSDSVPFHRSLTSINDLSDTVPFFSTLFFYTHFLCF